MADHKLMRASSNGDVELAREALREGANKECQALSPKPVRSAPAAAAPAHARLSRAAQPRSRCGSVRAAWKEH
jgi:hypothetical protein